MTHIRVRARLTTSIDGPSGKMRNTVFTDFIDKIGEGSTIDLPGIAVGVDPEKFAKSPRIPTKARNATAKSRGT